MFAYLCIYLSKVARKNYKIPAGTQNKGGVTVLLLWGGKCYIFFVVSRNEKYFYERKRRVPKKTRWRVHTCQTAVQLWPPELPHRLT